MKIHAFEDLQSDKRPIEAPDNPWRQEHICLYNLWKRFSSLFSHRMEIGSPESLLNKHAQLLCLNRKGPMQVGHSMFAKHENALTAVHYLPTLNLETSENKFAKPLGVLK